LRAPLCAIRSPVSVLPEDIVTPAGRNESTPPDPRDVSAAEARVEALERALRIIELEVYGRPEPFCRRIAAEIVEVLGVAPE
jgi:hypothetical protein